MTNFHAVGFKCKVAGNRTWGFFFVILSSDESDDMGKYEAQSKNMGGEMQWILDVTTLL